MLWVPWATGEWKLLHEMALGVYHDLTAVELWKEPQRQAGLFSVPLLEGVGWALACGWLAWVMW